MRKYWKLLGEYDAESTTWTAFAGGAGASPYTPKESGRLTGLRLVVNRSAATSLINHLQVRMEHQGFSPNTIEVGGQGTGLQTAPSQQQAVQDWDVDQPIIAGVPITIEGRNVTADTPVTVSALLYGRFET